MLFRSLLKLLRAQPEGSEAALVLTLFLTQQPCHFASGRVENARVTAYGARNRNLSRKGTTGADGRFAIEGMYPCEYVLEVEGLELEGRARVSVPPRGALVSVGVLSARAPEGQR